MFRGLQRGPCSKVLEPVSVSDLTNAKHSPTDMETERVILGYPGGPRVIIKGLVCGRTRQKTEPRRWHQEKDSVTGQNRCSHPTWVARIQPPEPSPVCQEAAVGNGARTQNSSSTIWMVVFLGGS